MKRFLFPLLFLLPILICAQKPVVNPYAALDKKALQLPDSLTKNTSDIAGFISNNFSSDKEKVRAAFIWIAANIEYDVTNMFAFNFYETKEDKIAKPLLTRRGICENYAALFSDVCNKAGIKSYVIEGYTKQNGFRDFIPHAWSAAFVDGGWYMFDPTWGSGYISAGKFVRKMNDAYYKAAPSALIKTHMPFDYLWQFLNYPVSCQDFYDGKIQEDNTKPFFSYTDSIDAYQKMNPIDQLKSSSLRIERNGIKNAMIYDRLQHIKVEIENDRQQKMIDQYNDAVNAYNKGLSLFNQFIDYRNKQFNPMKPDAEIQSMVDVADSQFIKSKSILKNIPDPSASVSSSSAQLVKSIDDVSVKVKEQADWLKVYFSKGKSGRKSMFYEKKVTWFGIPIKN